MKLGLMKYSFIFDLILILCIVATIITLIIVSDKNLSNTRRGYTADYMHILELIIDDAATDGRISSLGDNIIGHVNSNPNKIVEIYNEEYQSEEIIGNNNGNIDIKKYPNLLEALNTQESGVEIITLNNIREEVYFKWVHVSDGSRRLVLLYAISNEVFNYSYIFMYCYMIIVLVFILVIKIYLVDKKNYIHILRQISNMND